MRLLLLTPFPPDPDANHGGGAYLGNLCRGLQANAELGLVTFGHPDRMPAAGIDWQQTFLCPPCVRPDGSRRLLHHFRMLFRLGLRGEPLLVAKHASAAMAGLLRRACAEFQPTAVLAEMAVMAQFLPAAGTVPTILTDHEAGVPTQSTTGLGPLADRFDASRWRRYVRTAYARATHVQAVTHEDARVLEAVLGRPVGVRPAALQVPPSPVPRRPGPPRALFLGDYRHQPNPEAVARIVQAIWPRVRAELPDAELCLAGPNQDRLAAIGQPPGVRVLGFVADLPSLLATCSLLLAPLYSGGGFRVKHLTALAHGLPVVTNALGGRGITAQEPACRRAENDADLAAAALHLLRSPAEVQAASTAAHAWALANLSPAAVAARQCEVVRQVVAAARR